MKRPPLLPGTALIAIGLALSGFLWTPHDPADQVFREVARAAPSMAHPAGVDALGRDLLSRLWLGSAHTVSLAIGATLLALVVATTLLVAERASPRPIASLLRGLVNLSVAIPVLLIGLLLLVVLGPSPGALAVAAAVGAVPLAFRQLRVLWIEQRSALHVTASEVLGGGMCHRFVHAIWPNLRTDLAALTRLVFATAVLELSGLSFLGLIGDPDFPELGAILRQNQPELFTAPHLVAAPALVLALLLGCIHASRTRADVAR